jgi:IMP dehydrogenase
MAMIIGDYIGTTWGDFLVLPGAPADDREFTPEDVDISTDLAGVRLRIPFLTAAMRSVTGKDLALEAGKLGMMGVVPRGLSIEREAEIVKYVKDKAIEVDEIESEGSPTRVLDTETLGVAVEKAKKKGHSNIPIVTEKSDFVGMFRYRPSIHDNMDFSTPIKDVIQPYKTGGMGTAGVCTSNMNDDEIKRYLKEKKLRLVPVIDDVGRLDRLVFLQKFDAYKVGAAIDTHDGWEERTRALIDAGADMIFIDTSDAHKPFSRKVVERYKETFGDGPPLCGGNVVTTDAFEDLAVAGADVIKLGMGPGSICTTNQLLGVGAPPFWSLVEVARIRDEYSNRNGRYIPIIADGGIEGTNDIAVAQTHADAVMGAKVFGCFFESEGERLGRDKKIYPKGELAEDNIVGIKIYGEASKEAMETTGDMKRYATPLSGEGITTFQGVSGWAAYRGMFKPGVEGYITALKEAAYHVGAPDLKTYRGKAVLIRLSERAKESARPHGIDIIGD